MENSQIDPSHDENPAKGCFNAILLGIFFWGIIALMIFGCTPRLSALNTQGNIIATDPDRVLGLFRDMGASPHHFVGQWFYFPGMGWVSAETHYIKVLLVERATGEYVKEADNEH